MLIKKEFYLSKKSVWIFWFLENTGLEIIKTNDSDRLFFIIDPPDCLRSRTCDKLGHVQGFTFFCKILNVFFVVFFQNRAPGSGATSRPKPGMPYLHVFVKYITWIIFHCTEHPLIAELLCTEGVWMRIHRLLCWFFSSIVSWKVPDILHT